MDFKVGDRVRIIANGFEGEIFNVESRLMTSSNGLIDGCFIDFYDLTDKYRTICGLQAGELELIERAVEKEKYKTPEQLKIEDLEQRIEKLEKEVFKPVEFHDRPEETKPSLLTEIEIDSLKYWKDNNFKWVCKDIEGTLHFFKDKPIPYNIEELLKGECGNEN